MTIPDRPMTAAEFLDWDGGGHIGKLELVEGRVRAMAPASATHGLIQANLAGLLWSYLRQHRPGCRVGTETPISPRIHANDNVRAPDLAVTCAPPSDDKRLQEPILIVEVLSPSNQRETWESIRALASVPSVVEILVVDSTEIAARVFRREADGGWPRDPQATAGPDGTVALDSIGLALPMTDVYAGTHLAPAPPA